LQSLLAFKEQFISKTVAAQVIGSSGSDLSRSIYIDKGENAGLKPDMAVITTGGIVGKVWLVYPSTSLVLMINDQSSGVGVFLEKSRLQGVLRGTPNGELILERVMNDEQVVSGDAVLSSGGDQIFPKGLPVGTVNNVGAGKDLFLSIKVKPAADLSRLEEVLVVTEKEEREAVAESGTKVRAADILARRLPSVPDKPAAVPGVPPGKALSAKPQLNGADKPATAAFTKLGGKGAAASAAVGSTSVAGQRSSGEIPKKVVTESVSGDSDKNNGTGSAALTGTTSGTPSAASSDTSSSRNSPAKPAPAQPKPAGPQTTPQPAATEDSPH
jgi:rod shape-determining protein MreC